MSKSTKYPYIVAYKKDEYSAWVAVRTDGFYISKDIRVRAECATRAAAEEAIRWLQANGVDGEFTIHVV